MLDRLDGREDGREQCLLSVGHEFMNKALRNEIMYVRGHITWVCRMSIVSSVTISEAEAYELVTSMIKAIIANKPHMKIEKEMEILYKTMDKDGYISCIIEYDGRYYEHKVNLFVFMMVDDYDHDYDYNHLIQKIRVMQP